jgi:hypothetical protein
MRKQIILGIFIGCSLIPEAGRACECPVKPALETALAQSSVVFLGRVEEQGSTPYKKDYTEIKFLVLRKFKGFDELPPLPTLVLYTPSESTNCGYKFQNGFEYVVYATGNPAFLQTNSCSRTEVLEKAQLEEQRLIRLTDSKKKPAPEKD